MNDYFCVIKKGSFWSSWMIWTFILSPLVPVTDISTLKVFIWSKMQSLWLNVILILVAITDADNAKLLLEGGTRRLLVGGKCFGEYATVCKCMIRINMAYLFGSNLLFSVVLFVFSWIELIWLIAQADLSSTLMNWFNGWNKSSENWMWLDEKQLMLRQRI